MTIGVDFATAVTPSQFACLATANVSWAITRAWHSYGAFDTSAVANLANAKAAGLTADLYMFPCAGKPASVQALQMLGNLSGFDGKVWLDVEDNPSPGCSWTAAPPAQQCVFLRELVAILQQQAVSVGVYSNAHEWASTVGADCALQGEYALDLWYAHYDNSSSCGDFAPFGGWTAPVAKQWTDTAGSAAIAACGVSLDTSARCSTTAPRNGLRFHITDLEHGAHDVNALFKWKDVWHVFHQRNSGWGHLVSSDLATWERLPDALLGDGGAWDGSLTVVDGVPTILFDCTDVAVCQPAGASNDPPIIGVARPKNASDPNLTHWVKDAQNPIAIRNLTKGYAGPSNLWRDAPGGAWRMEMILGGDIEEVERGHTALFESTDPTLHAWELVNPTFWKTRGGGGGLFYPLPGDATPTATHMLQVDDNGGGNPWFQLGSYDAAAATFTADGGPLLPLDLNPDFVFSELHVDGGVMRHMGWLAHCGCLSIPREVTFDAQSRALLSRPAAELALLRGTQIGARAGASCWPWRESARRDSGTSHAQRRAVRAVRPA